MLVFLSLIIDFTYWLPFVKLLARSEHLFADFLSGARRPDQAKVTIDQIQFLISLGYVADLQLINLVPHVMLYDNGNATRQSATWANKLYNCVRTRTIFSRGIHAQKPK